MHTCNDQLVGINICSLLKKGCDFGILYEKGLLTSWFAANIIRLIDNGNWKHLYLKNSCLLESTKNERMRAKWCLEKVL
jgi:hypothetical protein